jgi:hypothetical protein
LLALSRVDHVVDALAFLDEHILPQLRVTDEAAYTA